MPSSVSLSSCTPHSSRMLPLLFSSYQQGVVTNFEIFRMREKQVPVDVVEMKGKLPCSRKGLCALVLDSSA